MKKQLSRKSRKTKKQSSKRISKANLQPKVSRDILEELEIGRQFMAEYREVFEKLAKN